LLRDELLNPSERYLTVVVRQSAYKSFCRRERETGVDFVEWIKMHVEAMNLFFEYAKPPSKMRAVLRRIIVIDDNLPEGFWDEKAFRQGKGCALDWAWKVRWADPVDTDCVWAIADDYRPEKMPDDMAYGYFWKATMEGDRVTFGRGDTGRRFTYPISSTSSSFRGKGDVWLDIGLIHEWSHYLFNLPDEYCFDCRDHSGELLFRFRTGYLTIPWASPFLSSLADYLIKRRLRDDVSQGCWGYIFKEVPRRISLEVVGVSGTPVPWQLYLPTRDSRGARIFGPLPPTLVSDSGRMEFAGPDIFRDDPRTILLRTGDGDEIYIPAALFMMSKMAGIQRCNCKITFTGYDDPEAKVQFVELVDNSDLAAFLETRINEGFVPYALTEADGTRTWFVWFRVRDVYDIPTD